MKRVLRLLAVMTVIILAHNVRAQALYPVSDDKAIVSSLNDMNRQAQIKRSVNKTTVPNSQIYLPDSLTLYAMSDTLRMSASYNLRGWNDQILVQVWFSGHWVNYTRQTWTYLGSNENNLTLQQTWLNGQWTNLELDSSTYDARGNMLVHLFKYWSQGAWKDSMLSSRIYDANGNMLTNVGWVMINNQWTNSWRGTYTYDANGNELTFGDEQWANGQWVNINLWTYTYDGNGHMHTFLTQGWNGQWQNATLSTYTYDANGNMLSFLLQNSANGQWTNYTLHTYTYDASGKMLTDWSKGWTNGAWMNGSLYTYTYDTNENMVNELIQEWLNGLWTNYRQSTITYDAHGNELTGNNTLWSGSSWVPTDYNFPLAVNGSTYNFTGYRIIISWILVNTTDVPGEMSNIVKGYSLSQNYPNPFNPSTTIKFELPKASYVKLALFNLLGQLVSTLVQGDQEAGFHEVKFDGSGLASGVYFYRLSVSPLARRDLVPPQGDGQAGTYVQTRKLLLVR